MKAVLIVCSAVSLAVAAPAVAQRPRANLPPRGGAAGAGNQPQQRALMERRVRRALYRVAQQRIGLNDGQMRQLAQVNGRYEPQRRALLREENDTRRSLRAELQSSGKPDEAKVSAGLAKLQEIQRRRLEIDDHEQRDLAAFLTPTQRAKYHALQEQLRRRLQQMRQQHRENQLTDDSIPAPPNQ